MDGATPEVSRSGRSSAGRAGMIHYLFGISVLTPAKIAWVAITLANVGMMLWLCVRSILANHLPRYFYFWMSAAFTLLQGSWLWHELMEITWAISAAYWVWSLLPRDKWGRIMAIMFGVVLACGLGYVVPAPWPHYDPIRYFTRTYSCLFFAGTSLACAFLPWIYGDRIAKRMLIATLWFATTVFQAVNTNWYYWTHQLVAVILYSLCLMAWTCGPRFARSAPADSQKRATVLLPRSLL